MAQSSNSKSSTRIQQLLSRVDVELAATECLTICPCQANGVQLTDLSQFSALEKETTAQRRDRKAKVLAAIHRGSLLPIDVGIAAGYVRFVIMEMNEEEDSSWVGKATSVLDASSGFIAIQDHVLQLPAGNYQANIFCYVPNRSAVSRLAATVSGWEASSNLVDNLKAYWKSTRRYKCPWTKKSLKCATAVVVQLLPSSLATDSRGKIVVKDYGSKQFALPWTYRSISKCPDLLEPIPQEVEESSDWEWSINELPKVQKASAKRSSTRTAAHPIYPILFSEEDFGRFRDLLLGLVIAAQESKRFEAHKVVPRLTASTLKEFDYLAEDTVMYPQLMLVLACVQIECGYIEPRVADEALDCIPIVERMYQLKLEGAQRKKANRELQKLSEDIIEFRDVEH